MNTPLSQETFVKLREFIYSKSGLSFPDEKKYLIESRLVSRLQAVHCHTYEDYYNFIRFDPSRDNELIHLLNSVTTNETFFFRDISQMDCFRQVILPQVIEECKHQRTVKIWSAGCSSGEEPFTLAMIIAEEFPSLADWDVQIIATDLSEQVLQTAAKGLYGPYAVRNVPPTYLQKYFTSTEGQFFIKPMLKKYVSFSRLNLFEPLQMRAMRDIDVIFCRNVMIYFDQDVRKRFVSHFYDTLKPSGILIIGFSESLSGVNRLFRPIPWYKTFFYTKADQEFPSTLNAMPRSDLLLSPQPVAALNPISRSEKSTPIPSVATHNLTTAGTTNLKRSQQEGWKFKGKVS